MVVVAVVLAVPLVGVVPLVLGTSASAAASVGAEVQGGRATTSATGPADTSARSDDDEGGDGGAGWPLVIASLATLAVVVVGGWGFSRVTRR
ncbi:MAG: hypothetical protein MUF83_08045 [Acidimicrobiales bacterium]|nr:hypothetical protein [Acidimicrobiales bacterium]